MHAVQTGAQVGGVCGNDPPSIVTYELYVVVGTGRCHTVEKCKTCHTGESWTSHTGEKIGAGCHTGEKR